MTQFAGEKFDGTFEVFEGADGWRWRLKGANNRTMAQSEKYDSKQKAFRGATAVQRVCSGSTLVRYAEI